MGEDRTDVGDDSLNVGEDSVDVICLSLYLNAGVESSMFVCSFKRLVPGGSNLGSRFRVQALGFQFGIQSVQPARPYVGGAHVSLAATAFDACHHASGAYTRPLLSASKEFLRATRYHFLARRGHHRMVCYQVSFSPG
jgi:hypothetical protein